MDILTDSHHITQLAILDPGRRRRWSESEKVRIVEECLSALRLASTTVRRHCILNQLLFAWRKIYREKRIGDTRDATFVSARIVPDVAEIEPEGRDGPIENISSTGWRVLVNRDCDEQALMRVERILEGLR